MQYVIGMRSIAVSHSKRTNHMLLSDMTKLINKNKLLHGDTFETYDSLDTYRHITNLMNTNNVLHENTFLLPQPITHTIYTTHRHNDTHTIHNDTTHLIHTTRANTDDTHFFSKYIAKMHINTETMPQIASK